MGLAQDLGFTGLFGPGASNAAALHEVDEDRKVRLGMFFYVMSDAVLAFFFFGNYIFLRGYNTNLRWVPPPLIKTIGGGPVPQTAWIMGIALGGALFYALGQWALSHGYYPVFQWSMLVATIIYLFDAAASVYVIAHQPFGLTDGTFADTFDLIAGYHVYHMVLGTLLGTGVTVRAFRGLYRERRPGGAESNASRAYLRTDQPTGIAADEESEPPRVSPHPHLTGIASIGYYWFYAAIYAVAVWLLLIIQPPSPLSK